MDSGSIINCNKIFTTIVKTALLERSIRRLARRKNLLEFGYFCPKTHFDLTECCGEIRNRLTRGDEFLNIIKHFEQCSFSENDRRKANKYYSVSRQCTKTFHIFHEIMGQPKCVHKL